MKSAIKVDYESEIAIDQIAPKSIVNTNENCITGDEDHLIYKLSEAFKKAKSIDIIVAFLMESGVKLLAQDLKEVVDRGIPIRILTGNYLNITQPQALYLLKDILGDKVDLRFYNVKNKSFHPKAYLFQYEDGGDIFIGSSNVSKSALTDGIEWNYRITKTSNEQDFNHFENVFEDLFLNKSIIINDQEMKKYSQSWVRPKFNKNFEKSETEISDNVVQLYEPRGAQIEALYELKKARAEGYDRGLIVAATGIGKTYLAAFDSIEYGKILFLAHREEILKQAFASFKNVSPNKSQGFFYGDYKEKDCDIVFASVQTLGKEEYLNDKYFSKNHFDYIVIDEVHHAVAGSYKNILEYFAPKFLLGLTATPERMDNKDVFALFNHEVVYETRLNAAINKGWLVPFRYYGIYDDSINYDNVNVKNGKYEDKSLETALMINKRANLILENYKSYNSNCALGFCSSRKHAEYMAEYFIKNGVKSAAVVSSGESLATMMREKALNKLKSKEISVIFSVDMFNEGLDIPSVDMVMFLRPTESPTIFLQQLGRGLRKSKDKKYLNVLDFIGNYKKANLVPFFLTGKYKNLTKYSKSTVLPTEEDYPEDCFVHIDFRLIDIFKKMNEETRKIEQKVIDEFFRVKQDLNHRPSRNEFYTYMDDDIYDNIRNKSKLNIFNDYLSFLHKLGQLQEHEEALLNTLAHEFIINLEITKMSQTYKMPLLLAFYNDGNIRSKLSSENIYESFKNFYSKGSNGVDLLRNESTKDYKNFGEKEYLKIAKNPMDAFINSAGKFFYRDGDNYCLNGELSPYINDETFKQHFKDVIDFRTNKFYKERFELENENI